MLIFLNNIRFNSNFCFTIHMTNLTDKYVIKSNQINQKESGKVCRCCAWVQKRVYHHQGINSRPRAQRTNVQHQVFRHPPWQVNLYCRISASLGEGGKEKFRHLIWKNVVRNGPETQVGVLLL